MTWYRRARHLALAWEGADLILTECDQLRRFRVSEETVGALAGLTAWTAAEAIEHGRPPISSAELARMVGAGMVECRGGASLPEASGRDDAWSPFELAVQRRQNSYTPPVGGNGPIAPCRRRVAGPRVLLPAPGSLVRPLDAVLAARRSYRQFADGPLPLLACSTLLHHAANGRHGPWRPYPTAGGLDELELYLVANDLEGVPIGAYYFDPASHSLTLVRGDGPELDRLNTEVKASTGGALNRVPPLVLLITARFGPTLSKYHGIGLSLAYKDTGCLFQTLYLVATALDLAPCAIGGGPEAGIARWLGLDPLDESLVGTFLLGPRSTRSSVPDPGLGVTL